MLILGIIGLLLAAVLSRYVFASAIVWIDEVVSISFIWLTMIGAALAMHRNEHLRLSLMVDKLPARWQPFVHAFALTVVAAFLVGLLPSAVEYAQEEWFIKSPALDLPNTYRVASIPFGLGLMLLMVIGHAVRTVPVRALVSAVVLVGALVRRQVGAPLMAAGAPRQASVALSAVGCRA